MKPKILVTRPKEQAQAFITKAEQKGFITIPLPCINITQSTASELQSIKLESYDIAILISTNAAKFALTELKRQKINSLEWFAVGPSTANLAKELGVKHLTVPNIHNSEGLLEVTFEVANKKIIIFRGNGGRELLGNELIRRGAIITYCECYQRAKPDYSQKQLTNIWIKEPPNIIVLTSCEILQNLYDITPRPYKQKLLACQLIVASKRIELLARTLGFTSTIINAKSAMDDQILARLD